MVRTGQDRMPLLFCPSWKCAFRGYKTETCHSNARLSIYRMEDTPAFVIKGDTPTFMMGDGMGDTPAFVIKGDAPLETCIFFTCIIGDAQWECAYPFY
jgi:hypothetical protein